MKKILISLAIIGAVAAIVVGATTAYFSDTETSTGNTITAGTINLTVNDEDPLEGALVTLKDMKPSNWFSVQTPVVVTDNPADIYKHYADDIVCEDGKHPESEDSEDPDGTINDLYNWTTIDLAICWDMDGDGDIEKELDEYGTPTENSECKVIIYGDEDRKLGDVLSQWIPLKENAEPGREYIVHQSFHLQAEVTNWAQGDICTFTEEFLAQQVGTEPEE